MEEGDGSWQSNIPIVGDSFSDGNMVSHIHTITSKRKLPTLFRKLEETCTLVLCSRPPDYARWFPLHIRDMKNLPQSVMNEFLQAGHWVVRKTKKRFSVMPIDQAHEQNNEKVKGSGDAVGLIENPEPFKKWMVAKPK